jgi:hypothetical protein
MAAGKIKWDEMGELTGATPNLVGRAARGGWATSDFERYARTLGDARDGVD